MSLVLLRARAAPLRALRACTPSASATDEQVGLVRFEEAQQRGEQRRLAGAAREARPSRFRSGRGTVAPAVRRRALPQARRGQALTGSFGRLRRHGLDDCRGVEGKRIGQDPDRRGQCAEHQAVLRPPRRARPSARGGDRQPQRARRRAQFLARPGDHRHPAAARQRARAHPHDPRRRTARRRADHGGHRLFGAAATRSASARRARRPMCRSRFRW